MGGLLKWQSASQGELRRFVLGAATGSGGYLHLGRTSGIARGFYFGASHLSHGGDSWHGWDVVASGSMHSAILHQPPFAGVAGASYAWPGPSGSALFSLSSELGKGVLSLLEITFQHTGSTERLVSAGPIVSDLEEALKPTAALGPMRMGPIYHGSPAAPVFGQPVLTQNAGMMAPTSNLIALYPDNIFEEHFEFSGSGSFSTVSAAQGFAKASELLAKRIRSVTVEKTYLRRIWRANVSVSYADISLSTNPTAVTDTQIKHLVPSNVRTALHDGTPRFCPTLVVLYDGAGEIMGTAPIAPLHVLGPGESLQVELRLGRYGGL